MFNNPESSPLTRYSELFDRMHVLISVPSAPSGHMPEKLR